MTRKAWLKCARVDAGMFSDELSVVVARSDGFEESFLVPKQAVKVQARELEVEVVQREQGSWATLPTEYPAFIPVRSQDLG
jgi:hypothetical protein